jgi:PAS domain S-box-containing protein
LADIESDKPQNELVQEIGRLRQQVTRQKATLERFYALSDISNDGETMRSSGGDEQSPNDAHVPLKRAMWVSEKLRAFMVSMNDCRSVDDMMEPLLETAVSVCGVDGGGIYLVEGEDAVLRYHFGLPPEFIQAIERIPLSLPIVNQVCHANRVIDLGPMTEEPMRMARSHGIQHIYSVPLRDGGQVVGFLNVASLHNEASAPQDLHHLWILTLEAESIFSRLRAEQLLRGREARLECIFRTSPLSIWVVSDRILKEVNQTCCQMLGYSLEELKGQPSRILYPSDEEFERVGREIYGQIREHGVGTVETRWQHKDGSIFDVLLTLAPLDPNNPSGDSTAAALDITDRKRAERALRESEERFRILFEKAPDGIYLHDLEGIVIDGNKAAEEITGYQKAELIGESILATGLIIASDAPKVKQILARITSGRPTGPDELTLRQKNGSLISIETRGFPLKIGGQSLLLGVMRDITERKHMENSLREIERKTRAIFNNSYGYIGILAPDGIVLEANRSALEFAGIQLADVVGTPFWETPWWSHSIEMQNRIRASVRTAANGDLVRSEATSLAADGTLHRVEFSVKPIMDDTGRVVLLIVEGWDVTERIQAEEKLKVMQMQLAHVARLSILGEMTAEMVHELNQPLYAILNYAKASRNFLAADGPLDLDSLRECNEEIAAIAKMGSDIVKRLRSFARGTESPRSSCPIEDIIGESIGLVAFVAQRAQAIIRTSFCEVSPVVIVERIQIQQVLVNLLQNAIESMAETPIELRQITIRTTNVNQSVDIAISDKGRGLPSDKEVKIFDAFVTTKPDGLGMGLAISKTIVEAHRGQLWAESNPQGGATFHCALPLANGDQIHVQ